MGVKKPDSSPDTAYEIFSPEAERSTRVSLEGDDNLENNVPLEFFIK